LDYLIKIREEYHVRRERALKKGDRVAVLGRGIAVVEQTDDKEASVELWNRLVSRIARKEIVLNQQNMRGNAKPTLIFVIPTGEDGVGSWSEDNFHTYLVSHRLSGWVELPTN
jgi:hypothetical protein